MTKDTIIHFFGYSAGILNCLTFLPQLFLMWKTKKSKDISLLFLFINLLGSLCWVAYGYLINSIHITITDSIISFIGILVIISKIYLDRITNEDP